MIGILACSAQKLECESATARELYCSPLFRMSLAHLEGSGCRAIYILSALHGVLALADVIKPYNFKLTQMPAAQRVEWGHRCAIRLIALEGTHRHAIVHAGVEYTAPLMQGLRGSGWRLRNPMDGLQIGERLAWLSEHRRRIPA